MTWMMNLARFVPGGLIGVAAVAGVAHFVVDQPSEDDHHMTTELVPGIEPTGERVFWGWIVGLNDGQPVEDARVCVVRERPDLLCADADEAGYWELIGQRTDFVAPGHRFAVLSFEADGYRPTVVSRSVWAQNPEIVVGLFPYGQFQQLGQQHGGTTGVDTGSILLVATEAPKGLGLTVAMPPPRIEPPPVDDPQFARRPGDDLGEVPTVPFPQPHPPTHDGQFEDAPRAEAPKPSPHDGTFEDAPRPEAPKPSPHEGTFEDAPRPEAPKPSPHDGTFEEAPRPQAPKPSPHDGTFENMPRPEDPVVRPAPGVAQHVPSHRRPIAKPSPDGRPHGSAGELPVAADGQPSPGAAGEYPAAAPADKPAPGVSDELPGEDVRPEPGTAAHVPSFAKPIAKPGHDGPPTGTADLLPGDGATRPSATTVDWGDVVVDAQPGAIEAVFGDNPLPPNAAEAYPAVPKTMWFGVQIGEVAVDLSSLVAEGCVPVNGWGFENRSSAPTMVMPGSVTWIEVVCGQ